MMFNSKEESMETWASLFGICRFAKFTCAFMRERGCGYNPKDPEKGKRIRIMRVTSEPNLVTLFFFFRGENRFFYGGV